MQCDRPNKEIEIEEKKNTKKKQKIGDKNVFAEGCGTKIRQKTVTDFGVRSLD